ncbi:hypothetical protein [Promicromonospora sp. NPDC050249]|uniref:hypothetical protein n=1 Tax=Promicromonospora sp. NPDC050249 TaxID=3154743 RepID=UPI0033D860D4
MTTIVAWAGVDQRKVASVYIASDSRISWGSSHIWNQGRKTFAATGSAHIFGYWGDVLFPSIALPTVLDELAAGVVRSKGSAFGEIGNGIRRLWTDYPKQEQRDFGIVMATRRREAMDAVFELAIMTFDSKTGTWDLKDVPMPQSSARLHIAGSGASEVRNAGLLWEESSQGGTSRAVYGAFTEALAHGTDPYSGGGPQLVGLRRIGPAIRFGTVFQGKRYLAGARVTQATVRASKVEWFNELFERVDGARGRRLSDAQRHLSR